MDLSSPEREQWERLLIANTSEERARAFCSEYGVVLGPSPRGGPSSAPRGIAENLVRHLLSRIPQHHRRSVRLAGKSLLRYALDADAKWALAELMTGGVRFASEDESFLLDLLRKAPTRWKTIAREVNVEEAVGFRDAKGVSLLHQAAANGNPTVVRQLLAAGASVHARAFDGSTPLHRVWRVPDPHPATMGHRAIAGFLEDAGASWDAPDAQGTTPFHLLLAYGAAAWPAEVGLPPGDPNAPNGAGVRPLSLVLRPLKASAFHEHVRTVWVQGLMERGADWHRPNADGSTPAEDFWHWDRNSSSRQSKWSATRRSVLSAARIACAVPAAAPGFRSRL